MGTRNSVILLSLMHWGMAYGILSERISRPDGTVGIVVVDQIQWARTISLSDTMTWLRWCSLTRRKARERVSEWLSRWLRGQRNPKVKRNILAIIPARGNSKGIPRKNVRLLCGKPLIAYTIGAALSSKLIDRVVVSTKDEGIAEVSKKYGAEVIRRPP